ncbi:methyl coenzyme M reductase subunit C [Bradyrhizobium elkanii]
MVRPFGTEVNVQCRVGEGLGEGGRFARATRYRAKVFYDASCTD